MESLKDWFSNRKLKTGDVIKDLLTLNKSSPDMFDQAFRMYCGDVSVENCTVTNASVTNVKGMTGGFVGYTSGEATYILRKCDSGSRRAISLAEYSSGRGTGRFDYDSFEK